MKKYLSTALLAFASASLLTVSAKAATVTYSDADLFIGFRATGGTGAAFDYLLDVGQVSQFQGKAPGYTTTLSLGNVGADLTATFGANWNTRSDVLWAAIGGTLADNTVWTSKLNTTPGLPSPAWTVGNDSVQGGTTSSTDGLGTTYDGNASTANSPVGLLQQATGNNSYASFQPGGVNSSGISFAQFNPSNEANFGLGVSSAKLDLDELVVNNTFTPPAGKYLGTFDISNGGAINFTVLPTSSVPEPSSFALIGMVGALALSRRNRKKA